MNLPSSDTRLTAYAFGELEADAKRALEAELAQSADMQRELAEIKISISALRDELLKSPAPALDRERRARVEHAIEAAKTPPRQLKRKTPRWLIGTWSGLALAAGAALFVTATRERKTASYQWTETAAQPPPATATAPLASAAPLAVEDS